MAAAEGLDKRRRIRPGVYGFFFVLFALVVFLSHAPFLRLPYYWDEAGYFIPAALDLLRGGHWIPQSTTPNVHPPAVIAYLAAAWRVTGYQPATTRCAMLLLASFGALAAFLLAIELSREVKGTPAFLVAALVCASPLFFSQAMMAQLDAPAMLFTTLALLLFLQDRIGESAAACVALVLVKETGIAVPLVFAAWLAHERRWREAAWFAVPAAAAGAWFAILARATGHWAGSASFARYNVEYSAHPARVLLALLRRLYYLFFANFHWVGALAILYGWRKSRLFRSRSWQIAGWIAAAHVVMYSVLGGAVLERYLLPILPILYAAMAAGLSLYRRTARVVCSLVLVAGVAAGNFLNPPYPFPYEDNLAFTDFIRLHARVAEYLESFHAQAEVYTAWPLTAELATPDFGFVERGIATRLLPDFTEATLRSLDWSRVEVLVIFSRTWDPPSGAIRSGPLAEFRRRLYGYVPNATQEEARALIPLPVEARFERRGQWAEIYVRRATPFTRPTPAERIRAGSRGSGRLKLQVLAQHDQLQLLVLGAAGGTIQDSAAGMFGDEQQFVKGQSEEKAARLGLQRTLDTSNQRVDQ